jgi:twinkle protein
MDVKGSGALTDIVDNSFSVWRNKAKENQESSKIVADAIIKCDKQRNGDWEGAISLFYDLASYQYREFENEKIKRYVPFNAEA